MEIPFYKEIAVLVCCILVPVIVYGKLRRRRRKVVKKHGSINKDRRSIIKRD